MENTVATGCDRCKKGSIGTRLKVSRITDDYNAGWEKVRTGTLRSQRRSLRHELAD